MKILVYERCTQIAKAIAKALGAHEVTTISAVYQDNSESEGELGKLFGTDLSLAKLPIEPANFDFAFVDHQEIENVESYQLLTALTAASVPCIANAVMPDNIAKLKEKTRLVLNKSVVIPLILSHRLVLRDGQLLSDQIIADLLKFESEYLEYSRLRNRTSEFMKKCSRE